MNYVVLNIYPVIAVFVTLCCLEKCFEIAVFSMLYSFFWVYPSI